MSLMIKENGCPFGTHRVLEPEGCLPQPAQKLNNNFDRIWDNEILIKAGTLNIDSASFTQIAKSVNRDPEKISETVMRIVESRGKMQNPVTGSGGVLLGTVEAVGPKLEGRVKPGDRIVTLVSLSLTPLHLEKIKNIKMNMDQMEVEGRAVLFENSIFSVLPDDIPEPLACAALDVCGAPAQTERLVNKGDTVVVVGAAGKSGMLCCYQAKKQAGEEGKVYGIGPADERFHELEKLGFCDQMFDLSALDAISCYRAIREVTGGKMADLVINCVNIESTEMACILMCKKRGKVYFFNMATSFARAALGAEGVGMDIDMLVGKGYVEGHDELTLNILRESKEIRSLYEKWYA